MCYLRLTHVSLWQTSPADVSTLWLQSVWLWALRKPRYPHTAPPPDLWGGPSLCLLAAGMDTATEGKPEITRHTGGSSRSTCYDCRVFSGFIHTGAEPRCPRGSAWWLPAGSSWVPACPGPRGAVRKAAWWSLPGWASAVRSSEGPSIRKSSGTLGCCRRE